MPYFCSVGTAPDIAPKQSPRTIKTTVYGIGHPFIICRTIAGEEKRLTYACKVILNLVRTLAMSKSEDNLKLTSDSAWHKNEQDCIWVTVMNLVWFMWSMCIINWADHFRLQAVQPFSFPRFNSSTTGLQKNSMAFRRSYDPTTPAIRYHRFPYHIETECRKKSWKTLSLHKTTVILWRSHEKVGGAHASASFSRAFLNIRWPTFLELFYR